LLGVLKISSSSLVSAVNMLKISKLFWGICVDGWEFQLGEKASDFGNTGIGAGLA
jgi:hypothetical protein